MRWWVFVALQVVIIAAVVLVVRMHDDHVVVAKKPPPSIAQWYRPQNKRQVWLHTMFELRRDMLAVETYAAAEDAANLEKWTAKLDKDYRKIAAMVPDWEPRLDLDALDTVRNAAREDRYRDVAAAVAALGESCRACHADFRAVTAALYRAPDFSGLKVGGGQPLGEHMAALSRQVNHIKIAFVDGRDADARTAFTELRTGMTELGTTCIACHDKLGRKDYPDPVLSNALAQLEESLKTGDLKAKGRSLGMVAVLACAQCHGTHRQAFDAKSLFGRKNDWPALLRHRLW